LTIATIHLSFRKKKKNNKKIQSDPRSLVVLNADIIVYLSERKSLMPCGSVKTMPFVCKPGIGTIKMSHPAGCFLNKSPQIVVARIIVPHNFTERYHHDYILRRSEKKGSRFAISHTVKHAKTKLKETGESNRFHFIYLLIAEASNKLKAQTERHLAWPR